VTGNQKRKPRGEPSLGEPELASGQPGQPEAIPRPTGCDPIASPDTEEELRPLGETAQAPDEIAVLQGRIAELQGELEEMRERWIRAVADLDNARKRARHEMAEAQLQAIAGVLRDILLVMDSFERALETGAPRADAPAETKAVREGVSLIHRQLLDILARRGVKPVEAIGQPFDPRRHEAVAQVPATEGLEDGVVALEMQKGYLFGDRVLRPSKVAVAAREAEGEAEVG
jgi:molecular chaperone GrpE